MCAGGGVEVADGLMPTSSNFKNFTFIWGIEMFFSRTAAFLAESAWASWRSDQRRVLYHYTTAGGLHGIVGRSKFRLTHSRHLNDETEGLHGAKAVDRALDQLLRDNQDDELFQVLSPAMKFALAQNYAPSTGGTFVGCFSTLRDSLPQWRGYGRHDSAFVIAIDAEKLFHVAAKAWGGRCWLLPVEYSEDKFISTFVKALTIASEEFDEHRLAMSPELLIRSLVLQVANYGSALKHVAFKEEQEWRLIVLSLPDDDSLDVQHLPNATLRPYVELDLGSEFMSSALLEVIVGPQSHQIATLHGVASFLRARTGRDIPVTKSEVPFNSLI